MTSFAGTTSSAWSTFLQALADERSHRAVPPPMRAIAAEIATRAIGLMFPQLARDMRVEQLSVHDEAEMLERLLVNAVDLVQPGLAATAVPTLLDTLPAVHALLLGDAQAVLDFDPAAESLDEVIFAYPGFLATAVHRIAHEMYRLDVPVLPRTLSEWAHGETGIDIHPGAEIGRSFAIDHGTGVVIGETSVIGDRVRIYQGVTLGALAVSKRYANRKRHPTLGNDVVVYANATILGGNTVVGDGSVIGGNVWLTSSVPPRSVVQFTSRVEQRTPANDDGLEFHI